MSTVVHGQHRERHLVADDGDGDGDPRCGGGPTSSEADVVRRAPDGGASGVGHEPARRRSELVLLAGAAAVCVVLAVAASGARPGQGSTAYSGYSASPQPLTASRAIAEAEECARFWDDAPAVGLGADDVLVAEGRGDASLLLVRKGADVALCQDVDPRTATTDWVLVPGLAAAAPATSVVVDSLFSTRGGEHAYSAASGRLGAGVTGVDVLLPDDTAVRASTAGGRWIAWWPGSSGRDVRVVVRTAHGQEQHPAAALDPGT